MAKSYVKFEVSKEVADKTYEALQLAKQGGKIRKGVNEATKSVERGLASFVVLAEDVEPEEVIMHLPMLCEQKKIPFSYVPSKLELGKAIGLGVQCAAVAIESQGGGASAIKDVIARVTGTSQKAQSQAPQTPAAQPKPKEAKPHAKKQEQKPGERAEAQQPAPAQAEPSQQAKQ
jgi:large subunit ribosomal protein L7Ae